MKHNENETKPIVDFVNENKVKLKGVIKQFDVMASKI